MNSIKYDKSLCKEVAKVDDRRSFGTPLSEHPIEEVASEAFRSGESEERANGTEDKGVAKVDDRRSFGTPLSEHPIEEVKFCRVCKGKKLAQVLSLGSTPPANAFLQPTGVQQKEANKQIQIEKEHFFPLEVFFCEDCSFVGLSHVVSPDLLFRNYVYVSSTSPVFQAHFASFAEQMIERFQIDQNSLVVDIGSNDGILLRPYQRKGIRVIGIDPATKIAEAATANGIETIPDFFTPAIAGEIKSKKGEAKIITATSVFPHINDLDQVLEGVKTLLAPDGVFIIEAYYLVDLIEKNLFDTIYHEHLSYFTVKTLSLLCNRLGMEMFDVEKTDTHGGSLRAFIQRKKGPHKKSAKIAQCIQEEEIKKMDKKETFSSFQKQIEKNKESLIQLLKDLKSSGKRIIGYGAPAKGNTLLNYFGIGSDTIDYIVDDSPWKQGLLTPGMHIPVVSSQHLTSFPPDYILILAWNFSDSIMKRCKNSNQFIIPVPTPTIVNRIIEEDLEFIYQGIKNESKQLEGKKILITGGSGFLGSYFIATIDYMNKNYFKKPCEIITVDNHIVGGKQNLLKEIRSDAITFIKHDVRTPLSIDGPVDMIIAAAGVASPVYYKQFPIETIEGTLFGLKNALELARKKKTESVLYFSSSEIYGDPEPNAIPTPETYKGNVSSIGPRSCYDESKRLGETLAMAHHRVHNTPVKIVRPFNVYGPGMNAKDYRVMPTFISEGLKGKALTVHDKGNQTRSFCYATDAIIGFFKVLLSNHNGEVFNIGNDKNEINMHSLANMISETVFNDKAPVHLIEYPDSYPQDEPRRRCPNLSKAKMMLGFTPQVDLKSGIIRSYEWMKSMMTSEQTTDQSPQFKGSGVKNRSKKVKEATLSIEK